MISIRWKSYSEDGWDTMNFASDRAFVEWLLVHQTDIAAFAIERY